MKKLVSISLVAIIILTSITGFAGERKRRLLNEVEKMDLYKLGIMVGDETGELHLGRPITRAEAIKMICVAGNIKPEIPVGQTCVFEDVADEHWAYEYICSAQSQGIICGDGKGNFYPEDKITNEEIIKILVCLLGYGVRAEESGGYPAGYTREAARLGITQGLLLDVYFPAIRNDVGIMLYQCLDIPMMESIEEGEAVILDGKNGVKQKTLRDNI